MSLLPDSACPDLPSPEPDEENSLHSMCSGQAHQACQPPKRTLQAPESPDQRVNFLSFFFFYSVLVKQTCPRIWARSIQDTMELYLTMWKHS